MNDSDVALERRDENAVGRSHQVRPESDARQPDATDELIIGAVSWHTSTVYLDNGRQQREERRTQVY